MTDNPRERLVEIGARCLMDAAQSLPVSPDAWRIAEEEVSEVIDALLDPACRDDLLAALQMERTGIVCQRCDRIVGWGYDFPDAKQSDESAATSEANEETP